MLELKREIGSYQLSLNLKIILMPAVLQDIAAKEKISTSALAPYVMKVPPGYTTSGPEELWTTGQVEAMDLTGVGF